MDGAGGAAPDRPAQRPVQRPVHVVVKYQCGAGVTPCGAPAKLYVYGWRCERHSPAAVRATTAARQVTD